MIKLKFIIVTIILLNITACSKTDKNQVVHPNKIAIIKSNQDKTCLINNSKTTKHISIITGIVTQILIKNNFSFIEINQKDYKKTWVAIINTNVKLGKRISIKSELMLKKFRSKLLNRTFDSIYFGHIIKF